MLSSLLKLFCQEGLEEHSFQTFINLVSGFLSKYLRHSHDAQSTLSVNLIQRAWRIYCGKYFFYLLIRYSFRGYPPLFLSSKFLRCRIKSCPECCRMTFDSLAAVRGTGETASSFSEFSRQQEFQAPRKVSFREVFWISSNIIMFAIFCWERFFVFLLHQEAEICKQSFRRLALF